MLSSSNKHSHLKALLKKNWILLKRTWLRSIGEISIPIIAALILVIVRGFTPLEDIPQTAYYNNTEWLYTYNGTVDATSEPFFTACSQDKGNAMIGLSPEGDSIISELKNILGKNVEFGETYL